MKRARVIMGAALLVGMCLCAILPVEAADLGLVQLLSQNLGVTGTQATGGAGSIFNLAKQNLSKEDFSKVAKAVPGIDTMMAAAPKAEGALGMLGEASSMLGGSTQSITGIAGLAGSFSQLGMKEGMVNAFIPVILGYVKSTGGEPVANILQGALK
jgi:hypothetical protein